MSSWVRAAVLVLLSGCVAPVDTVARHTYPLETVVVPKRAATRLWPTPRVMDAEALSVAITLTEAELEAQGYDESVPDDVSVYQTSRQGIGHYTGHWGVYGLTQGTSVWVGRGDVCDFPVDYDGRLLGWVLSHELLHVVGFEHGREMTSITDGVWPRWKGYCGL